MPASLGRYSFERVTASVFKDITETETPQGIAAIVQMKEPSFLYDGAQVLIDRVQDPGNLGTIIRTAAALGFSQAVLGKGTVDRYNPKVVRATQGSLFHMNIIERSLEEAISILSDEGYCIAASTLHDAVPVNSFVFPLKTALIVGNEGAGIADDL